MRKNISDNKKARHLRREKIFLSKVPFKELFKVSSANKFADAPADNSHDKSAQAVVPNAPRNNRDKNYRLDFKLRVVPEEIYQSRLPNLPIVDKGTYNATEDRRKRTAPAVVTIIRYDKQDVKQNHATRPAQSYYKFSHKPSPLFVKFLNYISPRIKKIPPRNF